MSKLKGILLTEGMHGMLSQVEGLAKALDIDFTHHKVELNNLWKLIPPKFTPISQRVYKKINQSDYDLIISAVPGFMGFETLKTIIETKKNVVDISFFPENALELNELAQKNNVTALVDFGVAPGLGNILFGNYDKLMKIESYECYVGGLPKNKNQPLEYKAPFSPIDVIEEYTRPARLYENNNIITKQPLTDIETIKFDKVGELEAFNTDGLRSLLYTMSHIPNMKE